MLGGRKEEGNDIVIVSRIEENKICKLLSLKKKLSLPAGSQQEDQNLSLGHELACWRPFAM